MAHGKCVYCESALEVTSYLEIDHYVAKTASRYMAFEWTNLLPGCRLCNDAKGEQDHNGAFETRCRRSRALLPDTPGYGQA
jgi:uncharacterized protein (TIGR02646 family)